MLDCVKQRPGLDTLSGLNPWLFKQARPNELVWPVFVCQGYRHVKKAISRIGI